MRYCDVHVSEDMAAHRPPALAEGHIFPQAAPAIRPQIVIGGVHEKVRDGRLVDEAALRFLLSGVDDLLDEIRTTGFLQAAA